MPDNNDHQSPPPPTLHSRRSLTLTFNIPIAKTSRFWDALAEGKFVTTKCHDCGAVSFPPQADCPNCMSSNSEWVDLGTEAELLTFTYVQITPPSFVDKDPYVVAIGRLREGGVNVLAWVEGADPSSLKPGTRLRIETRKDSRGPYYVFVAD
jgi:uncharacterized OB-fold protein